MKPPTITIREFHQTYPDNDACLTALFRDRFGHPVCPKCGRKDQYHKIRGRARFSCVCGEHHIFPKKGTIFEKSETDLVKWFFALFLFAQSRNGVAAAELQRELGVTYKTAWRIARQIRTLMRGEAITLSGEVEADDAVVGGKHAGKRGRGAKGKTIVLAAAERGGRIQADVIENLKAETLVPALQDCVARGTRLLTDEFGSYRKAARVLELEHDTVEHGAGEYAKGSTHVNTVEGFFSQLKRSLDGTYHVVSQKYLPLYVAEFQFRYNHGRREDAHLFHLMLRRAALPRA